MKRILKYELKLNYQELEMVRLTLPGHPRMLSVQVVDNIPYLYCLVNPGMPPLMHELFVYGTGAELKDACGEYVDSFIIQGKSSKKFNGFVGHLFITGREVGKTKEDER